MEPITSPTSVRITKEARKRAGIRSAELELNGLGRYFEYLIHKDWEESRENTNNEGSSISTN